MLQDIEKEKRRYEKHRIESTTTFKLNDFIINFSKEFMKEKYCNIETFLVKNKFHNQKQRYNAVKLTTQVLAIEEIIVRIGKLLLKKDNEFFRNTEIGISIAKLVETLSLYSRVSIKEIKSTYLIFKAIRSLLYEHPLDTNTCIYNIYPNEYKKGSIEKCYLLKSEVEEESDDLTFEIIIFRKNLHYDIKILKVKYNEFFSFVDKTIELVSKVVFDKNFIHQYEKTFEKSEY